MKNKYLEVLAASVVGAVLAQPVVAGNLLTNGDFEDFVGPFPDGVTSANGPITADSATWNIWRVWPRFESVDEANLIEPTLGPTPFPAGWGDDNFAQHHQEFTSATNDDGDQTDQIKQGIDGDLVVPNVEVKVSFRYINTEVGREVKVQVYGIVSAQEWSQFAPWACPGCIVLHEATLGGDYNPNQGWKTYTGSFTPTASYDVVAVGISNGGNKGYARGVDDVVLSQNQPPVCDAAYPSTAVIWPPNHKFVAIDILGVTDPDGDPVTIAVDSIYQDEPVNEVGDGNTSPDGEGIDTPTALVRAERAGTGNGRFYQIAFTADDGNGGECTGNVFVSVPKSQGAKGAAINDGAIYDSTAP
jgi:hypothetical protein